MRTKNEALWFLEVAEECGLDGEDAVKFAAALVVASALREVAHAITAPGAPGRDGAGGHVESLTEAVMGVTAGLCQAAGSVDVLAGAVADREP